MITALAQTQLVHLSGVDLAIIIFYFALVLAIGFYLRGRANTGEDFFMAGREMTAWVAGLSFLSANLGALELMGWAGSAYQYGILATHWYWIGAIPAMLFLALVMMPFYYISKTHSVPGYLKLRFGESSRALSAVSFAFMTVLMSGVNMFAMAKVMQIVLGWPLSFSIWISSLTVAIYVALGGLRSAIFNEVLQFFLIWAGALLIPILGLYEAGGWAHLKVLITQRASAEYVHLWSGLGSFGTNPMGINWVGIVFGLGAIISMGYWTTDFLVVQRILAAKDMRSAQLAPIIGAAFKMFVPIIVILPGLLGLALLPMKLTGESNALLTGGHSYNDVLPLMLARYCGPGLLGLGVTALIAGFMSGMAGNVSAFTTVWTYDIYRALINKKASDAHYVSMGRWTTVIGVLISVGTAYLVMHSASIMDYVQALFSFFIAPLFGTVILGIISGNAVIDRHVGLGESGSNGAAVRGAVVTRETDGAGHVPGAVGVCDLRGGYGGGQPGDEAEAGCRTGGPGVRFDADSLAKGNCIVSTADFLGRRGDRGICKPEHYFLVGGGEQ